MFKDYDAYISAKYGEFEDCPYCKEEIEAEADYCKYCDTDLSAPEPDYEAMIEAKEYFERGY